MPQDGEYLLNHARSGIVLALRAALLHGGRVGVMAYNCHTVANAVVNAGCVPVFVDVTEDLHINIATIPSDLDALVVTNLFGIHNDITAIRKHCPRTIIIVDNAHGYGLPEEGDFTVYSINQGKFPSIGEGGILKVAPSIGDSRLHVADMYSKLPTYSKFAQLKLFLSMQMKALAYSKWCYWLTIRMKELKRERIKDEVVIRQMAPGVRRLYANWLLKAKTVITQQRMNALEINERMTWIKSEGIIGDNGFMLVVRTKDVKGLKAYFAALGIEAETHFAHSIDWAKEFGYRKGSCPIAEAFVKQLIMIPTYTKI